ncbi:hypothetical protein DFH11DRAFT_1221980 [Phellopilus nigrolimitatus]|nr:hypothetical protein DFH11DRAFT_1221980 [Phellopilus nigrolimitatus]
MFSNNPTQDAEVKEYFRRAERNPDRRGPLRKEAFKRLLGFAHAEDALHKKLVTEKVKEYFVDFPDLQDEAINAVYDLCEDQDQEIRIAGYSAITSVSRVDRNWLLRNADVLVQLLQSDDDREVTVVKRALQEHVDLDARRTLQVLSDQCVYDAADLADEDERALRARLRSLVLQFLVEKYRVCVARVVRESDVEDILLKGMTGAIPQATHSEARTIVKEILINLPSLSNGPTSKGNSVLEVLLDATRSTLDAELSCASSESSAELEKTTFLLSLAEFLTSPASPASRPIPTGPAASRASSSQTSSRPSPPADPLRLLQFFVKLFTPNKGPFAGDVLEKRVSGEAGFKVIDYLCKAVEAATLLGSKNPGDLDSVKTHLVNVSPVLFGVLNKYISASPTPARERTTLRSRLAILRIIKERVLDSRDGYSPPPLLASALGTLQASLSSVLKESEPSVAMDEDTRTGEPSRPSNNEIEEAMETIRVRAVPSCRLFLFHSPSCTSLSAYLDLFVIQYYALLAVLLSPVYLYIFLLLHTYFYFLSCFFSSALIIWSQLSFRFHLLFLFFRPFQGNSVPTNSSSL